MKNKLKKNLKVVFWDYPEFTEESYLIEHLKKDTPLYLWLMKRFPEYGRVVDALHFFNLQDIQRNFNDLKLSEYNKKKWHRMIEVYDYKRK